MRFHFPLHAHAINHFVARRPFFVKSRNNLGRVLQIAVHQHHRVAARNFHAAQKRRLRAKIAAVRNANYVRVLVANGRNDFFLVVGRGIVHENNFVAHFHFVECFDQSVIHKRNGLRVFVAGNDGRNDGV